MSKDKETLDSREILFIFDSRDCCPNGEREVGNQGPRIDSISNRAMVTDLCLKRIIRDYFMYLDNKNDKILVRQTIEYGDNQEISIDQRFIEDLGVEESRIKKMSTNELRTLVSDTFIDHRLFGSMLILSNEFIATTGCVQFENSLSMNIPSVIQTSISSTLASESGKGAGSLGLSSVLDYGVFCVHGIVNKRLSELSSASEEDGRKLFEAMWNGVKALNTRTKFQMLPRGLISVIPKDTRFRIPHVNQSIRLADEQGKNFYECIFNLDELFKLLLKYQDRIKKIDYFFDPGFNMEVNSVIFNSFTKALKKSNISIPTAQFQGNFS
ncbi:MAG: hypothetical protein GF364_15040 [Candidatus Lokiarchaeota archaeon]|nr:hypothetical protein [Candidatus Lokiarchaeota archaeon]